MIEGQPALDILTNADYQRENKDEPDLCEYFVPVEWLQMVPVKQAFNEVGLFGNQNTVANLRRQNGARRSNA